ncbi:unnamed protein product [Rotaria magnacalcarata]|nr:unnamed protein product [Rotaria magnacalcarata]
MNYNNYNNQLPLQSTTTAPPPVQRYMNNQRRSGALDSDSMQSYYNYNNRSPRFRNRFNLNRRISHSGSREQRRSGPRQLRLNDFIPTQLRNTSPGLANLPSNFNLTTDPTPTAARPNPPANVLPQRSKFVTQTQTQTQTITAASYNTTQPFIVNADTNDLDQQQQSSQQKSNTNTSISDNDYNYNRFTDLTETDADTDIESNYDDVMNNDAVQIMNKNNNNNKTKQRTEQNRNNRKKRSYLEPNRIMRYMQDSVSPIFSSRGNQAYILASTTIHDDCIRNNYD